MWFTDGSKVNDDTGAGVYCPGGTERAYPLGTHATVFQAEVFAILRCCGICIHEERRGNRISICSDSRAALLALQSPKVTSQLVWECRERLCELAGDNEVELRWVPGHSGIPGNEAADRLARDGSSTKLVGPEPCLGVPGKSVRGAVYAVVRKHQERDWLGLPGQRQSKELNRGCIRYRQRELLKLSRDGIRRVVGLLTGHCALRKHLLVMGIGNSATFRGCAAEDETAFHVLCDCEAYAAHRFEHFGSHFVEPGEISNVSVGCILRFINATGLPL